MFDNEKFKFKKVLLAALCASTVALVGCNDDNDNDDNDVVVNPPVQQQPSYSTYVSQTAYTAQEIPAYAKSIDVMTYKMPYVNGKTENTTAMIMMPKTEKPADGWRVVVWAHGTVGAGDVCAPSRNEIGKNFAVLAESLLKQGYVIVAPDYEGLGLGGIHPYLHLESAAQSAIYAIKAVQEKMGNDLNGAWMSVGQSQGGQASLGIAQFAGSDFNYKGTVASAPASSLGRIITQIAPTAITQVEQQSPQMAAQIYAELLAYAAYAVTGIKASEPNFDLTKVFKPRALTIAQNAQDETNRDYCLPDLIPQFATDITNFVTEDTTRKVMDYPAFVANFDQNPSVIKFLEISQPGMTALQKPVYIVQGQNDMAVPAMITQGMVDHLNKISATPVVTLDIVAGAGHSDAVVKRNSEVVAFINKTMPPKL